MMAAAPLQGKNAAAFFRRQQEHAAAAAAAAAGNQDDDVDKRNSYDRVDDWRLRDTADWILRNRSEYAPPGGTEATSSTTTKNKSSSSSSGAGVGKVGGGGSKKGTGDTLALAASDEFPISASIQLLKRQKSAVIQAAFTTAATVVLNAFLKKTRQQGYMDDSSSSSSGSEDDEDDNESHGEETIPNLPSFLVDKQRIAALRQTAFLRSIDNKEWAKKRVVVKADPVVSSSSSILESKKGGGGGGRKRKAASDPDADSNNNNNNESPDATFSASTTEAAAAVPTTTTAVAAPPKFTRNTPASSAAALDHRFTNSRAILCAAGNLVWAALTANYEDNNNMDDDDDESAGSHLLLEPNNVPQKKKPNVNLGAVLVDANVYAQRAIAMNQSSVRRAEMRYLYRQENARCLNDIQTRGEKHYLRLPPLFTWKSKRRHSDEDTTDEENDTSSDDDDDENEPLFHRGHASARPWEEFMFDEHRCVPHAPNESSLSEAWQHFCLPRLLAILQKGSGHVLYHDLQWFSRHGRLAHFLKTLAQGGTSFGPHLIVTTNPDLIKFAQEFHDMRTHVPIVMDRHDEQDNQLRVLVYDGNPEERCVLRQHFTRAMGLPQAPFHVVVVSYTHFLEDYLHFCQVPFEVILLDEGASWMAASNGDPNSPLAAVWEQGIWSRHHQHAGVVAGSAGEPWDFSLQDIPEAAVKEACLGLTARHRILTAPHLVAETNRSTAVELMPISGVVSFVAPIFASVVQEEWDRSNIAKDADSMQHFRKLVARSMVIHHGSSPLRDMHELAMLGLEGQLGVTERFGDPITPDFISDDEFVAANKVTFSRRACLSWLGTKSVDWLRYELGSVPFQHILDAMKISNKHGHFCEEITTASSLTSSGATGQVSGTMAYRMAVCCLRHFGSEQGLRQHISAQHAPPGTWLCRTCGSDCITSQARTHHERACGQPTNGSSGDLGGSVGATPTVGQGGSKSGVGKKKSQRPTTSTQQGGLSKEEKDPDGSLRVPGYRGVWVNKEGKHFIKVNKQRHTGDGDELVFFDSNDAAARMYDELVSKDAGPNEKLELNFKEDGTRNVYEDATSSTASGLGGSAANVVPLLSVINIKDLPPDVKPLLRDPRQTSRTGGNSKRHVYAYRGVCRQARKGHDRWQSQISFMGVNHYLGTFDSEWDAAAIYSWAHLILYGEEATKQAQKEGEEAAEAYEQEKRDIAAGKIPAEPPKPEKKPKQQRRKPDQNKPGKKGKPAKADDGIKKEDKSAAAPQKRKAKPKEAAASEKKIKAENKNAKYEKEAMNATLALGAVKTPVLGEREAFENLAESKLKAMAAARLAACHENSYCVGDLELSASPAVECVRPCLPFLDGRGSHTLGAAMLVGLPHDIGWSLEEFVDANVNDHATASTATKVLGREYDEGGVNSRFRSVIQGSVCVLGQANKRLRKHFRDLVGIPLGLGCTVGEIDCHIGGNSMGTCSEKAACIRYVSSGEFQLCCLSDADVVTLNGQRISTGMEWVALEHNDICSIGPRVLVFVLPK